MIGAPPNSGWPTCSETKGDAVERRGQRLLDLVAGASDLAPEERHAWLVAHCDDDTLRADALALLSRDQEAAQLFGEQADADQRSLELRAGLSSPPMVAPALVGKRLGDYAVEEQIGAGGMGIVFRARQISLNRIVALKTLPHHLRFSANGLERFRREVEAAAGLHHPNIVTVFASGDDGVTAYYAMEYVEGPSLGQVVESLRRDPIPAVRDSNFDRGLLRLDPAPPEQPLNSTPSPLVPGDHPTSSSGNDGYFQRVARLLAGVAEGLQYAHDNDVVHRDIKPSNLWFSADGRLRIGDFGLARVASEPGVTQTGEVIGTPYYMAPEQLTGRTEEIDSRTDVYAVGATLYELLTLQPPCTGATREAVLAKIVDEEPRRPGRINRRVPRDLETVCLMALEKHPSDRYPSAAELAADLHRFADDLPVAARRSGWLHRAGRWCARHPSLTSALAASLVLAAVAASLAIRAQRLADSQSEAVSRETRFATELQQAEAQIAAANETEQRRLFQRALLSGMQGDADAVSAAMHEAEQRGATEARLGVTRGQIHLLHGAFDAAIAELESAAELAPERVAPRAMLAETYARAGLYATAAARRAEAVRLPADSVEDLILLGRMELQFDPRDALRALDAAIGQDRRNIVARLIRGSARAQVAYLEADPAEAEDALADLRLAGSLLDETPYLLSQFVNAHLVASAGYAGLSERSAADLHLEQAGSYAKRLDRFPGDYEAHRWRAYYFERVGDLDSAISDWRTIEDKTIGYLITCLYQAGRFEEATAACERYRAHTSTGTADFCHSFVVAATAERVDDFTNDFQFENQLRWDPSAARIGLHTLWNLAGDPQRAADEVRALGPPAEATEAIRQMHAYYAGQLSSHEYLRQVAEDRRSLAQANLDVGVERLGAGRRAQARKHFRTVLELRLDYEFATALCRCLLAQLDREPTWPAWIPDNSGADLE